jgi:hypothetical protein
MGLNQEIKKWQENRRLDLIKSYKEKGFEASGDWVKDLTAQSQVTPFKINIKMLGSDYTFYMINGRKPGKMPPVNPIRKWIEDKGLKLNPYAVAKKIQEEGTLQYRNPDQKKKKLIEDAISKKDITELLGIIRENTINDIRVQLNKTLR